MKTSKNKIFAILLMMVFFAGTQLMAQEMSTQIGDLITLDKAEKWMETYNAQKISEVRANLYGGKAFTQLLNQEGVVGVKIYNGLNKEGIRKIVLKGLDQDANEIGLAYDFSKQCPLFCGGGIDVESIGNSISASLADELISNFANKYPISPSSYIFSAKIVKSILDQDLAKGMVLAYGVDDTLNPQLILLGLTEEGEWLTNSLIVANPQVEYNPQFSAVK